MSLLFLFAGAAASENDGALTATFGQVVSTGQGFVGDRTGQGTIALADLSMLAATEPAALVMVGRRPRTILEGTFIAPAATIEGTLDVAIPARASLRAPRAVPVGALDLRLTLDGHWRPRRSRTEARIVVANPGEHVVVVESEEDTECLVIVQ